ncbi:hypothetical protein O1611_g7108 [Lasiodiplodia mahajangana]|uniref:Uncharacterized protein n=1 Tax=Lasiodiplodia mahajangana TaxID=1108764 RepID=A0ACC2JGB1_9PEZI|nr:hypothetical protein O1611_g7108 [Lasiodiplodia mahajangana]
MDAQPLSPWATRFRELLDQKDTTLEILFKDSPQETSTKFSAQAQRHSGIAVEFPRRDPKYYNDPLSPFERNTQPRTGIEFDRLFVSEQLQRRGFHGSATWELTALNRFLWISDRYAIVTGGHLRDDHPNVVHEAYQSRLIKVDESRWFEFLRKHRWYDLYEDSPGLQRNGVLSVDDPTVWSHLRVSIELADRILKTLIHEQHSALETILFGRIVYWREIPSMANSRPFENALVLVSRKKVYVNNGVAGTPPPIRACLTLDVLVYTLTQRQFWSFAPNFKPGDVRGQSRRTREYNLGFVNSELLRHLCINDLTMAETFMLQFQLTIVLIRGLMQSLIAARYHLEGAQDGLQEPFVDFDAVSEIGVAMESRIWGGRFVTHPVANSVPLSTALVQWPSVYSSGILNHAHPDLQDGVPLTIERYPALYLSKFFVEEFWQNSPRARKSDYHFKAPFSPRKCGKIFMSGQSLIRGAPVGRKSLFQSSTAVLNGGVKTWNDLAVNETNRGGWDRFDQAVVAAWWENQYIIRMDRQSWYGEQYQRWASTPWGIGLYARQLVDSFYIDFEAKDEVSAYRGPAALVVGHPNASGMMDWANRDHFFRSMPAGRGVNNSWVYFSIGLLMLAALPIRTTPQQRTGGEAHMRLFVYTPSTQCRQVEWRGMNAPQTVELTEPDDDDPLRNRREANVLLGDEYPRVLAGVPDGRVRPLVLGDPSVQGRTPDTAMEALVAASARPPSPMGGKMDFPCSRLRPL